MYHPQQTLQRILETGAGLHRDIRGRPTPRHPERLTREEYLYIRYNPDYFDRLLGPDRYPDGDPEYRPYGSIATITRTAAGMEYEQKRNTPDTERQYHQRYNENQIREQLHDHARNLGGRRDQELERSTAHRRRTRTGTGETSRPGM